MFVFENDTILEVTLSYLHYYFYFHFTYLTIYILVCQHHSPYSQIVVLKYVDCHLEVAVFALA